MWVIDIFLPVSRPLTFYCRGVVWIPEHHAGILSRQAGRGEERKRSGQKIERERKKEIERSVDCLSLSLSLFLSLLSFFLFFFVSSEGRISPPRNHK